ncbi:RNA-binding protein [Halocynthiibacter sp.]|uniref:RNA-binding protein n=1 Tax=Halocynthiibacter sp. TaxID=1979210 RepID=UPI003C675A87
MARGGRIKDRDVSERRCIATGETQPKAGLIRFAVGPEAQIVPDVLEKLPGRGIWVAADRDALTKAVTKGLFSRGAKQKVQVADDLVDQVEAAVQRNLINLLSLARKGGYAVQGYEKVKGMLANEMADVLIQASDGSARGKSKLRRPEGDDSFIGILTGQELGLAFGRENVIHCALATGGLTLRVVEEAKRLHGVRGNGGDMGSLERFETT